MKRFLFAAVAAMMITSCATDEVKEYQRDELRFNTSVQNATRATTLHNDTFSTFTVWGFHEGNLLMNRVEVSKTANGWSYGDQKYFWPATGTVDFFAMSNTDLTNHYLSNTGFITSTPPAFNFEANPVTTGAPTGYTIPTGGCILPATVPDLLYATAIGEARKQEEVLMNFRHAISEVEFAILNNSTSGLEVAVGNYIVVEGLKYRGKYSLPNTASTSEDFDNAASHGSWALNDAKIAHVWKVQNTKSFSNQMSEASQITGATQLEGVGDNLDAANLVLPQAGTITVSVPMVITQNGVVLYNDTMKVNLAVDWKEGYQYRYTLVLNDDTDLLWAIDFTATVDNIKTTDDTPVRVPDGTVL